MAERTVTAVIALKTVIAVFLGKENLDFELTFLPSFLPPTF
jgi:hypothetical protein